VSRPERTSLFGCDQVPPAAPGLPGAASAERVIPVQPDPVVPTYPRVATTPVPLSAPYRLHAHLFSAFWWIYRCSCRCVIKCSCIGAITALARDLLGQL